jgi:hypothetical protein
VDPQALIGELRHTYDRDEARRCHAQAVKDVQARLERWEGEA